METLNLSSSAQRRLRTRSLIQLGGLVEKAGLLDLFEISLGLDLQKDTSIKNNVAALFKGLIVLKEIATSINANLKSWESQGLALLSSQKISSDISDNVL